MFAMKSRPPTTWLPRIRLPRSRHERHDFAMIAPQYTNSTIGVNVRFWNSRDRQSGQPEGPFTAVLRTLGAPWSDRRP